MGILDRKTAIVTGGASGIGLAIARRFHEEGANVVPCDIRGEKLDKVFAGVSQKGQMLHAVPADVKVEGDITRVVKEAVGKFGSIDILVNCAGIGEVGSIIDVPLEVWQHVVDVHLNGTFNCCRHACSLMAHQRSGRIMNVGSHAFLGTYGGTGYAAAKGGIISLTRAIARDMGEYGVTCNAFCPGARTRLSSGQWYEEHIRALHAKGLLTEAQKNAALNPPDSHLVPPLILYLATDEAANITGQVFTVAGGHVGLFPEPKEVTLIYKNYKKYGPWTIDEIARLLPSKLSVNLVNSSPAKPSDEKVL